MLVSNEVDQLAPVQDVRAVTLRTPTELDTVQLPWMVLDDLSVPDIIEIPATPNYPDQTKAVDNLDDGLLELPDWLQATPTVGSRRF